MGHRQTQVNLASPRVSEMVIVEIQKQPDEIEVIQSFNVIIPITRMETIVAPNTNFVRGGILTGFAMDLGRGSGGVLMGRNLNRSFTLPATTIGDVGTPQMVFINSIMTIHVNMTTY